MAANYYLHVAFSLQLLSLLVMSLKMYTTSEGQGSVELSIIVSNFPTVGAPRPFTLSVSTENGSAGMAHSRYLTFCALFLNMQWLQVTIEL